MAKRQKNHQVRVAFHYLMKARPNPQDRQGDPLEEGFSEAEFQEILRRLSAERRLDVQNEETIKSIKSGTDLPFSNFIELDVGVYFGNFEGAYYGQRYRNNLLGEIDPDSLNLRKFAYLVTRMRDGKILVGVSYHGQFGDFDGIKSCFSHFLRGDHKVTSHTLKSIAAEIGDGNPVEVRLSYRRQGDRPERRALFGRTGSFAIRSADFGDGFADHISDISRRLNANADRRRAIIADMVRQGEILDLNEEDIVSCSAIVKENGNQRTVYFLGENNFSTKFPVDVNVNQNGEADWLQLRAEMVRVLREKIIPLLM